METVVTDLLIIANFFLPYMSPKKEKIREITEPMITDKDNISPIVKGDKPKDLKYREIIIVFAPIEIPKSEEEITKKN